MKKNLAVLSSIIVVFLFTLPACAQDDLALGKAAFEKAAKTRSLENFQTAINHFKKAAAASPNSYDANWMCARVYVRYASRAKYQLLDNWKEIAGQSGQAGMPYAEKAIQLAPGRVEGYFWHTGCISMYSEGVSMMKAIKEGFKDKIDASIGKAYDIDKMYSNAGPIVTIARMNYKLPWPMRDKKKSRKFFKEYRESPAFGKEIYATVFYAENLMDIGGKENKAEARALLEKAVKDAAAADNQYYVKYAEKLIDKL